MTFAAVEAGGTKFRAAVVDDDMSVVDEAWIPTTTPDETLGAVEAFFAGQAPTTALGIASFGPLIVDPTSPDYGSIASTPKPGWTGAPLLNRLRSTLGRLCSTSSTRLATSGRWPCSRARAPARSPSIR